MALSINFRRVWNKIISNSRLFTCLTLQWLTSDVLGLSLFEDEIENESYK